MPPIVEEFTTLETTAEGSEDANDPRRTDLLLKLGLKDQHNLPRYRHMTQDEKKVYDCLFPVTTELSKFTQERIPLRVLEIIDACGFAPDKLYVMHKQYVGDDPILIAKSGQYNEITWLIARWGDVLQPFAELRKQAAKILRDRALIELWKIKTQVDASIEGMKLDTHNEALYSMPWFNPSHG